MVKKLFINLRIYSWYGTFFRVDLNLEQLIFGEAKLVRFFIKQLDAFGYVHEPVTVLIDLFRFLPRVVISKICSKTGLIKECVQVDPKIDELVLTQLILTAFIVARMGSLSN